MNGIYKIVLSSPVKGSEYTRVEIERKGGRFTAALYTAKQVFHKHMGTNDVDDFVKEWLGPVFTQYNAWDATHQHARRITKKGKTLNTRTPHSTPPKHADESHNREKNHIFHEGMNLPILVDAGIFTHQMRIAAPMRDKFIQINRFVELLADETKHLQHGTTLNIIDSGSGKSYLTFLVYHYFTQIRGLSVRMTGLDTDAKLVRQCNETAAKHQYRHLHFIEGDIGQQTKPPLENWGSKNSCNIIISLHACDTATDYTLHNAVRWGADLICAVPCCQHELRNQMKKTQQTKEMALFSRYGIIQERIASLATDAIRAALLESLGYRVSLIELTSRENTAKNILLRAAKTHRTDGGKHEKTAIREAEALMSALGIKPKLWSLLSN